MIYFYSKIRLHNQIRKIRAMNIVCNLPFSFSFGFKKRVEILARYRKTDEAQLCTFTLHINFIQYRYL